MMDAADESVVAILGYMAGRYTFEGKKTDAFFRGLGRLLCDLELGELEDLRTLASLVCTFDWEFVDVEMDSNEKYWAPTGQFEGRAVDEPSPHGYRIFALLKREQLGGNTQPSKTKVGEAPPNTDASIELDTAVARQIFAIVMPPGTELPETY
jgi:hypothetical protein